MDEIGKNLAAHRFYHGTDLDALESILQQGFREWMTFEDDDGSCEVGMFGGVLGTGVYITCDWRIALGYGPALLRVGLRPGTRILHAAVPPDPGVLAYLQHEFGRAILTQAPWRALPENKQLTLAELIALFRYHYHETWEKSYGTTPEGLLRWPRQRDRHSTLLDNFRRLLIRYGFHGYGNPADVNGIVLFAGDRIVLQEFIGEVPQPEHNQGDETDFQCFRSVESVRQLFMARGSERARKLAEQIAARHRHPRPPSLDR